MSALGELMVKDVSPFMGDWAENINPKGEKNSTVYGCSQQIMTYSDRGLFRFSGFNLVFISRS